MATLRSLLTSDAASGGALFPNDSSGNPKEFNETVQFYPRGSRAGKQSINAVVDRDALPGSREAAGDGVTLERIDGRSERESIVIEIPASIAIADVQHHTQADQFKVGGVMFVVKRVIGKDAYLQSVLCVRTTEAEVRATRMRRG